MKTKEAAAHLGSIKTEKKASAARKNGQRGTSWRRLGEVRSGGLISTLRDR